MARFIVFIHGDAQPGLPQPTDAAWGAYSGRLREDGRIEGGSSIGVGRALRREGAPGPVAAHIIGYLVFEADAITDVEALMIGNPDYEAGATVEIRTLPEWG